MILRFIFKACSAEEVCCIAVRKFHILVKLRWSLYVLCDKKVRFNLKEGYAEGVCCIALHRSSFLSMCRSFRLRSMYVSIIFL